MKLVGLDWSRDDRIQALDRKEPPFKATGARTSVPIDLLSLDKVWAGTSNTHSNLSSTSALKDPRPSLRDASLVARLGGC